MDRKILTSILIILVVSFVIRIYLGYHWQSTFFNRGNNYPLINLIAGNLLTGNGFNVSPGNPTIEHELLYPVFIAACYGLFGYSWLGVTIFQGILSFLTGLIIYLIARHFTSAYLALGSLLLTTFHPFLFIQSLSVADTTFFTFLLALLFLCAITLKEKPGILPIIMTGFVSALLMLTRDSAIALIIPLLIYMYSMIENRRRIFMCSIFVITLFICIAPWLIRNTVLSGRPILSSHGYEVLWQGNNTRSGEFISRDISVDEIPKPLAIDDLRQRNNERTTALVIEEGRIYTSEVKKFIAAHPAEFVKLMLLKFVKLWTWKYNPQYSSPLFIGSPVRSVVYTVYYLPLLVFALTGILYAYSKNKQYVMFCIFFLILFSIIHMMSVGFTRLRVPIDPLLAIFAPLGFYSLYRIMAARLKLLFACSKQEQ